MNSIFDLRSYDWIVINSSAGKDSQAMLDYVTHLARIAGVEDRIIVVHADLGRVEWKGTKELFEILDVLRDDGGRCVRTVGRAERIVDVVVGEVRERARELVVSLRLARVEAEGQPFDPAVHDAVTRHEDPDVEVPMVSDELQSGYTMHERLVRPAIVRVAMPPETAAEKGPKRAKEEQSTDDSGTS